MESCFSSLIWKYCLGIFTVCFSLLFSLRKFGKQTYFRKPRSGVFLINSSIWILKRNFKSIVNIGGICVMFETLIKRSQMMSEEPATSRVHRFSFWEMNSKRRTFSVPTRRFWAMNWRRIYRPKWEPSFNGDAPGSNRKTNRLSLENYVSRSELWANGKMSIWSFDTPNFNIKSSALYI